ncbi:threonine/serine ThrE exporter family protein [Streptococcus sciuri]|uniref:Threonine/serine exporter family protein n=1 Tax=Streptococcus sciuri TaxID=2973939 RepID=A0ABT2F772_9STRE|nr:threonine/serine exporter family protein [Streptococcus sciuri]MCS4488312.1 threonine/serine exporter family protein [Streptococcus sciuri]
MTISTNDNCNTIQIILKAGKILVESGAEIYRVEQTMGYLANALGMKDFDAYVISNGIMASAINTHGQQEAAILNVYEQHINLGKIEAVNTLSRQLIATSNPSAKTILKQLNAIDQMKDYNLYYYLLAYFMGAGAFSLALGSSLSDSCAAALTGLFLGLTLHSIAHFVHTGFLLTIIGSSVACLSVNLLHLIISNNHRSLILLGALMVLVPGAIFTSSVREFSQNNFSTGLTLLMSSLFICISISVGVVAVTELFSFAKPLQQNFSADTKTFFELIIRAIMAGIGTIAFAILFQVPKRYFLDLGSLGGLSWLLYLLIMQHNHIEALAVFIPGLLGSFLSRILATKRKCPMTIFLSISMMPLIPGLSLYRAIYFLLTGANQLAIVHLRSCFITALMIAIAINIVQQFPKHFFNNRFLS